MHLKRGSKRRGGFLDKIPIIGPLLKGLFGGSVPYGGSMPYGGSAPYGGRYEQVMHNRPTKEGVLRWKNDKPDTRTPGQKWVDSESQMGNRPSNPDKYKAFQKYREDRGMRGNSPPLMKNRPLQISDNSKLVGSGRRGKRKGGFIGAILGAVLPALVGPILNGLASGKGMRNKNAGRIRKRHRR